MSNFISTRKDNTIATSKEAIINGLANDGGLFVPINIKKYYINDLYKKSIVNNNVSFQTISKTILSDFFDDLNNDNLTNAIDKAYATFTKQDVTPTIHIGDDYLLELYYGRTSAFKDVALSLLPYLLTNSQNELNINKLIYILCATSGDTGKAALEGFKNVKGTYITVFYPNNAVSKIQHLQMITTDGDNTNVVSLNDNFDVCQTTVKNIMNDRSNILSNRNIIFSSANSINIGRLAPQIIYYFKSYFDLVNKNEIKMNDVINFIVPTGNFGDILAGYFAKFMGLPIDKLICASNKNNILTDFLKTGIYDANRDFYNTYSPSMDILISSNLERLLFMMSNNDKEYISNIMNSLSTNKKYSIEKTMLNNINDTFLGYFCDNSEILDTIKYSYNNYKVLIDPHTACALNALDKFKAEYKPNTKNVILSTASPYKFSNVVLKAIANDKLSKDEFDNMMTLYNISKVDIPTNLAKLKELPIVNDNNINKENAIDYIKNKINELEKANA